MNVKPHRSARRDIQPSECKSAHSNKTNAKTANQMPAPLKEVCDELRKLVRRADVSDAKARYEIGAIVLRVLRDKNNT